MKFLKNHGKKVSVVLLAMALMVTPMLNIVKAADDVTCTKKYHYFFIEEETAYIKSDYTLNDKGLALTNGNGTNQSVLGDGVKTFTRNQYTSQYAVQFGFNGSMLANNKIIQASKGGIVDGNSVMYKDGEIDTLDTLKSKNDNNENITKSDNLYMVSSATFYNKDIPKGYTVKEYNFTDWTRNDWNLFTDMYINAYKVAGVSNNKITEDDAVLEKDNDYYFIHSSWSNDEATGDKSDQYLSGATDTRNSDTTGNMPMFAQWKAANKTSSDSEVSSTIDKWQSASLSVSKMDLINSDTITSKMGDSGYPDLTIKIKRNYGSLTAPKSFWEGTTQKNVKLKNEEDKQYISNVDDTYYYYMFPTMLNVTFEGKGADVCNASVDTKDEAKENNPDTGVASYAIIGTLLVGAASAYIYARKNNKFNRV